MVDQMQELHVDIEVLNFRLEKQRQIIQHLVQRDLLNKDTTNRS